MKGAEGPGNKWNARIFALIIQFEEVVCDYIWLIRILFTMISFTKTLVYQS